jgi:hypothetical protein
MVQNNMDTEWYGTITIHKMESQILGSHDYRTNLFPVILQHNHLKTEQVIQTAIRMPFDYWS